MREGNTCQIDVRDAGAANRDSDDPVSTRRELRCSFKLWDYHRESHLARARLQKYVSPLHFVLDTAGCLRGSLLIILKQLCDLLPWSSMGHGFQFWSPRDTQKSSEKYSSLVKEMS